MGIWLLLIFFLFLKKKIKGFIGIASAPEFLEELMWKKFSKKIKKIIMKKNIYHLKYGNRLIAIQLPILEPIKIKFLFFLIFDLINCFASFVHLDIFPSMN